MNGERGRESLYAGVAIRRSDSMDVMCVMLKTAGAQFRQGLNARAGSPVQHNFRSVINICEPCVVDAKLAPSLYLRPCTRRVFNFDRRIVINYACRESLEKEYKICLLAHQNPGTV